VEYQSFSDKENYFKENDKIILPFTLIVIFRKNQIILLLNVFTKKKTNRISFFMDLILFIPFKILKI